MSIVDKLFGNIIIGCIIFAACICAGWWFCYLFNLNIGLGMILGITAGLTIDCFVLRKVSAKFFEINNILLVLIYALYMIMIFGFFMGVPIFNIIPGILASFYMGRKMKFIKADKQMFQASIKKVYLFSTIGLVIICIFSAYIAITDPYTVSNLEGMLNLSFKLNDMAIWAIIIFGGGVLVGTQYYLGKVVGKLSFK